MPTHIIKIENIDCKIWNLNDKIIEIISAGLNNDKVIIDLNGEGPDLSTLELDRILYKICQEFNWSTGKFIIKTSNLIETNKEFQVQRDTGGLVEIPIIQQITDTFDKDFENILHFGFFVGRSNWNRLWLGTILDRDYKDKTVMTYHCDVHSDFHGVHIGLDDLAKKSNLDVATEATKFLKKCPIQTLDIPEFPIPTPVNLNILKLYPRIFVDVICETYSSGTSFFPTEKTWRAIISKTPFVIQGPKDFLTNLHKLGFKTFDPWWDESYDQTSWSLRVMEIENTIRNISSMDIKQTYTEMLPVLEHNYNVLKKLTYQDIEKVFIND